MLSPRPDEDEHHRRYWALAGNPRRYRLLDAVNELRVDSWTTKGRDLRPGDRVVIWKYKGTDDTRGAVALGEVVSLPELSSARDAGNLDYWRDHDDWDTVEERAQIRYVKSLDPPLWIEGPHHDAVTNLSVSRSQGGTVFKITPDQWDALVEAAGGWPTERSHLPKEIEAVVETVRAVIDGDAPPPRLRKSAAERRAIELHAMTIATEHYRNDGWIVTDVSANNSYDLSCQHPYEPESVLHVEVKGTTGDGSVVLLTANEVKHAENYFPMMDLFVVANIHLEYVEGKPRTSGGNATVHGSWKILSDFLRPIAFQYHTPKVDGLDSYNA